MARNRFLRLLGSTRVRAGLSLGVVAAIANTGTFAYWTASATVTGTSFQTGTLDLQVNNTEALTNTTGTLSMSAMAPGNTSAQVLTLKNAGTVPLKWTLTGLLTNAAFNGELTVTVTTGTVTGSGNSATCSGTVVGTATALTTTSQSIIATAQPTTAGSGMPVAGTTALCFQVAFDPNAPTSLQSQTTQANFTFSATSNIS
ncbi:MAG: TasA family protein [Marmoricola sp.]